MPQGSHFSCFAKKSNQKKATPTFALILRCSRFAVCVNVTRMLRCRYAECVPKTHLGPRNTPLLGVEYTRPLRYSSNQRA